MAAASIADDKTARTGGAESASGAVIKPAGRVFEVLECIRDERHPMSVRKISERLGYPLSSTSVLMRSMAALGYLAYDRNERAYFPTLRVAMLGDWLYELVPGGTSFRPMLEKLAELSQETVVMAIQNDIFSQYVDVIQSSNPLQLYFPPGTRRLMASSGTGWAMLARQSDEAIAKLVHRTNLRGVGKHEKKIETSAIIKRVQEVRSRGYAFSKGAVSKGVGLIAVSFHEQRAGGALAIGVGGMLSRISRNEKNIVKLLKSVLKDHI